mmetsp:Transcript_1741/g.5608  ORF Transcript_1741/g.5608 Transcript_1741/m.5608 type:complete len:782 (-) Transcript_1741:43-2388(-)
MHAKSRRQVPAFEACATGALLVLGTLCLWQALQLRRGQWQPLGLGADSNDLTAAPPPFPELKQVAIPAESPFRIPAASDTAASTAAGAAAAGVPSFPAEGPLDALAAPHGALADDAGAGESGACNDVHPNADSPDMLHVVFASDAGQAEGVQASIASVVASAAQPEELTVHVMVQKRWTQEFKRRLGLRPECQGTVTVTGVLIRVHSVDGELIEGAVAKVSKDIRKERGAIDSIENFARFYMHLVFDFEVAIYLDADTIVQADLGQLRKELLASKKTVGFVARKDPVKMDKFLRKPKNCNAHFGNYKKLLRQAAYNVGVIAVNLQRWKEQRVAERVEGFVAQHNKCGGKLWVGGSQPPLLLAFLDRPEGVPEDFIVFDAAWNAGDLGWRTNLAVSKLRHKYVLHWNGSRKPWQKDGLYRELWTPHRQKFGSLLRPYDADGSAAPDTATAAPSTSAPGPGPEELAARAACPYVQILAEWPDSKPCRLGGTYGCDSGHGMWTRGGCAGLFNVTGAITACGSEQDATCAPGELPRPSTFCGIMIMTTYFTTKKDWQRGKYAKASFSKFQKLYQTSLRLGMNVTVVYDNLPEELIRRYSCARFHFAQVNLADFDRRYGVNDVRYFFFDRLVRAHPDWGAVFIVDAFDVRVGMNPCPGLKEGMLYVGHEQDRLKKHPWMKARFQKMGGKYNEWYKTKVSDKMKILNCGITGGRRDVMVKFLTRMVEVLSDPALAVRQKKEDINLNMASLNYIVYTDFAGRFAGNTPVHSFYKRFETKRKDVWFIHK